MSFLPDAERWEQPSTWTFAEFAADVHRVAHVLSRLGVGRRDAVAIVSVNCQQLASVLLAAEAVGIAAPINPALSAEHAAAPRRARLPPASSSPPARSLIRRRGTSRARSCHEPRRRRCWRCGRWLPVGDPPPLEPLDGATVAYLEDLAADAPADGLPAEPPVASDLASYLHTGGTTGTPKLAARTHANEVSNAWMIAGELPARRRGVIFAALPLFHTNALLVTLMAPLMRGQHVVWAGPLGYRDAAAVRHLLEARRALPDRRHVRRADGVRGAGAGSRRRRRQLAATIRSSAPRRCRPRSPRRSRRPSPASRLCEGYGLTEGTCASARNFPALSAAGLGGAAAALPGDSRSAHRRDHGRVGAARRPARSGRSSSEGPNVFAGYLAPGARRAGSASRRQDQGRLARHRRSRLRRRRRLRALGRPRQGPHHPRRSQHRSRGHRGRAARASGGQRGGGGRRSRCACGRGARCLRHRRAPAPAPTRTSCVRGPPTTSPSAPPHPNASRSSTPSR